MNDFHWAMQVIGDLDAGLIVLDQDYQVCTWNAFMQSYSGITSDKILGKVIFDVISDLPETWLRKKLIPRLGLILEVSPAGKIDLIFLNSKTLRLFLIA